MEMEQDKKGKLISSKLNYFRKPHTSISKELIFMTRFDFEKNNKNVDYFNKRATAYKIVIKRNKYDILIVINLLESLLLCMRHYECTAS